jgi:hypothetical protein
MLSESSTEIYSTNKMLAIILVLAVSLNNNDQKL